MLERLQVEEATNVSELDVVATGAQAPARLSLQRVCARVRMRVCVRMCEYMSVSPLTLIQVSPYQLDRNSLQVL